MSAAQEKYRDFCIDRADINFFSTPLWLDTVAGKNNWDVVIVERNNKIVGALTYIFKHKYGFYKIVNPQLTQHQSILIVPNPDNVKVDAIKSYYYEIVAELINGLPKFDSFQVCFHNSFQDWLPFYWKGFQQTTRYSHIINNLQNFDAVVAGFTSDTRRRIKLAANNLEIFSGDVVDTLYDIQIETFKRQGQNVPFDRQLLQGIFATYKTLGQCELMYARTKEGTVVGGLLQVHDARVGYGLVMGDLPDYRKLNSNSLLQYESLKLAAAKGIEVFDYCGTMMPNLELNRRLFGIPPVPYNYITKTNSKVLKIINFAKYLFAK